jgi:hypothetical protein
VRDAAAGGRSQDLVALHAEGLPRAHSDLGQGLCAHVAAFVAPMEHPCCQSAQCPATRRNQPHVHMLGHRHLHTKGARMGVWRAAPPPKRAPTQRTCAAAMRTSHSPVTITRCSRAMSSASTGFIATAAAAMCAWLQASAVASCFTSSGVSGRGAHAYSPQPKLAFSPSHHAADLRACVCVCVCACARGFGGCGTVSSVDVRCRRARGASR